MLALDSGVWWSTNKIKGGILQRGKCISTGRLNVEVTVMRRRRPRTQAAFLHLQAALQRVRVRMPIINSRLFHRLPPYIMPGLFSSCSLTILVFFLA